MADVFIVEAVRSAIGVGKADRGALSGMRADVLLSKLLSALVERAKIDPGAISDVVAGVVTPIGEQGYNLARMAVLEAKWPVEVTGVTVNRMCGSSQQAIHQAAHAIMAGQEELVVACGVESMSRIPMGHDGLAGAKPWPPAPPEYPFDFVLQGTSAELIAEKWSLSREELDGLSLESHRRAVAARAAFAREIVPLDVTLPSGDRKTFALDEGPREATSMEKLRALPTVFKEGGVVHAGNSSQISDGAAAVLLASEAAIKRYGLKARARIVATATAGVDPVTMLTGVIPATRKVLARAGLSMKDIDLFEVNEAFASVVGAWQRDVGADLAKVNVRGGAIALGHPLGASGARLATTLLHALEDRSARYGLQTMCIGFGQATATIVDANV
ncbi:MAG: thiolase family protein [Myxococcales bacterium]|nr:thiolase family protein [Myxococcales bacterium]